MDPKLKELPLKTKTDITAHIGLLRGYGYKVLTFQNNRRGRGGTNSMTDYLVIGNGRVAFIEGKVNDKLSDGQSELMRLIKDAEIEVAGNWNLRHYVADLYNTKEIVNGLSKLGEVVK